MIVIVLIPQSKEGIHMTDRLSLGDRVKEAVTGFTGIAVARMIWLHGCVRIEVQSEKLDKHNKTVSSTFDEAALDVVEAGARAATHNSPVPQTVALGDRVKDVITGFAGIAIGRVEWLHSPIARIEVQQEALDKDNKTVQLAFDEGSLKVTHASAKAPRHNDQRPPGGYDRSADTRNEISRR
jgi:hypothetical protein